MFPGHAGPVDEVALQAHPVGVDDVAGVVEGEAAVARVELAGLTVVRAAHGEEAAAADRQVERAAGLLHGALGELLVDAAEAHAGAEARAAQAAAEDIGEAGA